MFLVLTNASTIVNTAVGCSYASVGGAQEAYDTIHYPMMFKLKALFLSYGVICSPWQPLSAIQDPVKSKLPTTNCLSL